MITKNKNEFYEKLLEVDNNVEEFIFKIDEWKSGLISLLKLIYFGKKIIWKYKSLINITKLERNKIEIEKDIACMEKTTNGIIRTLKYM